MRTKPMRNRLHLWLWVGAFALLWPAMANADYLSDGKKAFAKGDLRTAAVQLRNAVRTDPQNGEAHFMLARTQFELGDLSAAEKEVQAAIDRGFDKQQALPLLISAYLAGGKYDKALEDFQVQNLNPATDAMILVARGLAYNGLKRLDEAEKAFNEAEALAPNSLQPTLANARLALARGDIETAQQKLDRAEQISPNVLDVELLKSQLLRMKNDPAGALELLNVVIIKQPNAIRALSDRAALYLALGRDAEAKADNDTILAIRPKDVTAIFMRALLAARAQDFVTADANLAQIDRYLGRLPRAYYLQAVVKQKLGLLEQAEDAAIRFNGHEPGDLDGIKMLARIELLKRKPVPAIATLNKTVAAGQADSDVYDLLGRAFSMNGQSSEAVEAFRRAQLLAPDNVGVNSRLASAHLRAGETDAAIIDLERTLRLAPTDTAVSEQLFAAALATGDISKAEAVLARIKAALGDAPTVGNLEAVLLMARLDIDGARAKLQEVVRRSPDFDLAKFNLARLALMVGQNDEAERQLSEILRKSPASDPALSMYVGSLVGAGKIPQAIEVLQRARDASPSNNRIVAAMANLYDRIDQPKKALELLGADKKLDAIPTDLLMSLARAQIALGRTKDARDTYAELLDRDHTDLNVRRTLAAMQVSLNSLESARNTLTDGLKIDPQAVPLMEDLVAMDLKAGGIEPAMVTVEKFERLNADFPLAQALRGDVYMATKQWDQAVAAYTKAMKQFANPPTALMIRLGSAQFASGNADAANAMLRAWVKANPKDEDARRFLGEVNLSARRYAEAVQDFEALLAMRPRDPKYLNNLAWLYQQIGDKRALATAQQAYILLPVADVADTLGWILLSDGSYPTAVVLLRQAYGEAGNDPRIAYHYAVALQKSGQIVEAGKVLRPIVDSGARFDERADAIKLLADLTKGS